MGYGDIDWIDLAQDRDRWRAFVNALVKMQVPGFVSFSSKLVQCRLVKISRLKGLPRLV